MSTKDQRSQDEQENNLLGLSDDEFVNLPVPDLAPNTSDAHDEDTPDDDDNSSQEEGNYPDEQENTGSEEDNLEEDAGTAQDIDSESDTNTDGLEAPTSNQNIGADKAGLAPVGANSSSTGESLSKEQLQEFYNKLNAPFRANGKELQIRSAEDAISLMQMGANYNKKMAGIKEVMPYVKMLQKHGLMDEQELSFLIDLKSKKPEAIAKLLQDSQIDLYNFDTDQANDYKPGSYAVSPQEIALDEALQDIQHSNHYKRTVETLGVQWDKTSQGKVVQNPQIIGVINQHMETGLFDVVWQEVERQRLLGYLQGVPDLDAYYQVGEALNQAGYFRDPQQQQNTQQAKQTKNEVVKQKKTSAATTGKPNVSNNPLSAVDILSMSDEEFAKIGMPHLM